MFILKLNKIREAEKDPIFHHTLQDRQVSRQRGILLPFSHEPKSKRLSSIYLSPRADHT